jgi:multidrug efflux pump subunit AcrA (membrane-fusion protein)
VALRQATVSAKAIYKVDEVLVQEGQPVKQGQVIARLDDTNARAALAESKAQVQQLEAALAAAKLADEDARPTYLRNQMPRSPPTTQRIPQSWWRKVIWRWPKPPWTSISVT